MDILRLFVFLLFVHLTGHFLESLYDVHYLFMYLLSDFLFEWMYYNFFSDYPLFTV